MNRNISLASGLLLALLSLPILGAVAPIGEERGCVSGDCTDGFGTWIEETDQGLVRYQGNFLNGKYHGFGKLELLDRKITYKGNFSNGKRSGRGTQWDRENNVYMGQWRNDRRNGMGLQAYRVDGWREDKYTEFWLKENTENYYGEFVNDQFNGEGTYRWPDGVKYVGEWAANQKHGKGYFLYPSGNRVDRVFNFDERVYGELLPR